MFLATLVVLGFLVLPIVAIFARVPLHLLVDQLRDPIVRDALELTAITNAIALVRHPAGRDARPPTCSARVASVVARS